MSEIIELFLELDTDNIPTTQWGIQYRGSTIDCISLDDEGVHLWGGNPFEDEDKYFEEYLPTKEERRLIYEQILECA